MPEQTARKLNPEEKTYPLFSDDQRQALKSGNEERKLRGLPDWEVNDFVRCHPMKFPEVDCTIPAPRPTAMPEPQRADQRPA